MVKAATNLHSFVSKVWEIEINPVIDLTVGEEYTFFNRWLDLMGCRIKLGWELAESEDENDLLRRISERSDSYRDSWE